MATNEVTYTVTITHFAPAQWLKSDDTDYQYTQLYNFTHYTLSVSLILMQMAL